MPVLAPEGKVRERRNKTHKFKKSSFDVSDKEAKRKRGVKMTRER